MEKMEKMQIYVFGRGHVVIAPVTDCEMIHGFQAFIIKSGYTIRKWGAKYGIGQLANGPTESTILDAIPYGLLIPLGALHSIVQISKDNNSLEKWENAFKKADSEFLKA